jgi:hypothetical protein
MTGTDLCVNKPQSVPVIFEPPCIFSGAASFDFINGQFVSAVSALGWVATPLYVLPNVTGLETRLPPTSTWGPECWFFLYHFLVQLHYL